MLLLINRWFPSTLPLVVKAVSLAPGTVPSLRRNVTFCVLLFVPWCVPVTKIFWQWLFLRRADFHVFPALFGCLICNLFFAVLYCFPSSAALGRFFVSFFRFCVFFCHLFFFCTYQYRFFLSTSPFQRQVFPNDLLNFPLFLSCDSRFATAQTQVLSFFDMRLRCSTHFLDGLPPSIVGFSPFFSPPPPPRFPVCDSQ